MPLKVVPLAYPFGGIILNLNACASPHKDPMDQNFCVVIPLGDFEGVELCLSELGLVIEGQPGDIIIFWSPEITHFNLPYSSKRASIVLHTGCYAKSWVKDCHGWGPHVQ